MADHQITIDAILIDKISGAVGKMTSSWTEFNSAMQIAATVGRLVEGVYNSTVKTTLAYADSVRALTDVSSASAEEASRFIQVLDDYNLTSQDALTATKALTKQGLEPTLDTLANLSAEYNSLNSAEEQNAFILKNLGKGGLEWARVLGLGEAKIRELNSAVNENLVLTQQQIDQAETLRLNQDQLKDTYDGLMTTFGNAAIPELNERLTILNKNMDEHGIVVGYIFSLYEYWFTQMGILSSGTDTLTEAQMSNMYATQAQAMATEAAATNNALLVDSNQAVADSLSKRLDLAQRLNGATREDIRLTGYTTLKEQLTTSGGILTPEEAAILNTVGQDLGVFDANAALAATSILKLNKALDDGKISAEEYIKYLNGIPTNITTIVSLVKSENGTYSISGSNLQQTQYAQGGQFVIPSQYGNEGFQMGANATASAGETVTITPRGKPAPRMDGEGSGSVVFNIYGGTINMPESVNGVSINSMVEGQFG